MRIGLIENLKTLVSLIVILEITTLIKKSCSLCQRDMEGLSYKKGKSSQREGT